MIDGSRNSMLAAWALVAAIIGVTGPAASADFGVEPVVAPSRWTFVSTSYNWLSWLSGDTTIKGRSFDVDVSPDELIDALDWSTLPAWMSYTEVRNGRLILFNDIVYAKLAGSADYAKSVQGRFATLSLGGDIEADATTATIEAGAAYEFWSTGAPGSGGFTAFDALAGGRYWYQEVNVSADLAATLAIGGGLGGLKISGNRVIAKSGIIDWVDPFIGGRLRHTLAPGQELVLRGDVGGFGVGSDFSWQILATSNWQICVSDGYTLDAYLGYRALSVDYSQGSGNSKYEYDVLEQGPVIGMTARF